MRKETWIAKDREELQACAKKLIKYLLRPLDLGGAIVSGVQILKLSIETQMDIRDTLADIKDLLGQDKI